MTSFAERRVALLLFVSGLCAVAYQSVWLRHLRLVFGASTAASAAVLAVFMGGLGVGSLVLGPRADRSENALRLYARLEAAIAVLAGASPWLVEAARWLYIRAGGTPALGAIGGAVVRIVLTALILGPATFLMGGTLPAAVRAVAHSEDRGRRSLGLLYGANTLGAVTGALGVTFVAVEQLGIRRSIWVAALVNLLLGVMAGVMARRAPALRPEPALPEAVEADEERGRRWEILAAAAAVGFAFFLMELVWYRMLGPILGGTSYTFGLILALALAGIGLGGFLYGRGRASRRPTLHTLALTCAAEALAIALPFAIGDRLALAALVARNLAAGGFAALVLGWAALAAVVVLPAAVIAGYQFPVLAGILGAGRRGVGTDVGRLYAWNTAGAIAGSLAGGFGLLPWLGALGAWRLVVVLLAIAAGVAAFAARRRREGTFLGPALIGLAALLALAAPGPSAAWRHGGIGAGRFAGPWDSPNALRGSFQNVRATLAWEADGRESSVAVRKADGHAFYINGKSDGSALRDAATQVMGGLVGSMLHPDPRSALVIGLGTGETAGWLAAVPGMEHVEVVEIEPAILRVAQECAAVNRECLRNPKVTVDIGDARELLQVGAATYDIVFSEPSNPYRAGISSLFTVEFYDAVARRLRPHGIFLQWLQGYDVDAGVVRDAFATLHAVFPEVEVWQLLGGDLLLVATSEPIVHDVGRVRRRVAQEPYRTALENVWGVAGAEGFYSGFLAPSDLAGRLRLGQWDEISTDDRPRVEFGFIRNLGRPGLLDIDELRRAAGGLRPPTVGGALDWSLVEERRRARSLYLREIPEPWRERDSPAALRNAARLAFARGDFPGAARLWQGQEDAPEVHADALLLAIGLASRGEDSAPEAIGRLMPTQPTEAMALEAWWHAARGERDEAVESLAGAFTAHRSDPWPHPTLMGEMLSLSLRLAAEDSSVARRLQAALAEPFAVAALEQRRLLTRVGIAELLGDPAACRAALAPLEGAVPWDRLILEARVRCYDPAEPLGRRAQRDLERYRAAEPRPLLEGAS